MDMLVRHNGLGSERSATPTLADYGRVARDLGRNHLFTVIVLQIACFREPSLAHNSALWL